MSACVFSFPTWDTLIKIEMDAYSVYMSSIYTPIVDSYI